MKTLSLLVLAIVASLSVAVSVASSQPQDSVDGASGSMSLTVHTHSSEFGGPGGNPLLLEETDPLEHPVEEGAFSYSSVSCEDPARFNDRALNFNPDYPGIDDPAPVRHIVEGTVTEWDGKTGTAEGTITTFLCEDGEEGDQITIAFEGRIVQTSDDQVRFRGTYQITGGTGTFSDLTGMGSITGEFTCLAGTLQNVGAESCADLGAFSDAVFRLKGHYADPTA